MFERPEPVPSRTWSVVRQRKAVAAQPIGARVADMQHMRDAPAQHQRGEGASHAGQLGVALALANKSSR